MANTHLVHEVTCSIGSLGPCPPPWHPTWARSTWPRPSPLCCTLGLTPWCCQGARAVRILGKNKWGLASSTFHPRLRKSALFLSYLYPCRARARTQQSTLLSTLSHTLINIVVHTVSPKWQCWSTKLCNFPFMTRFFLVCNSHVVFNHFNVVTLIVLWLCVSQTFKKIKILPYEPGVWTVLYM